MNSIHTTTAAVPLATPFTLDEMMKRVNKIRVEARPYEIPPIIHMRGANWDKIREQLGIKKTENPLAPENICSLMGIKVVIDENIPPFVLFDLYNSRGEHIGRAVR